MEQFNNLFAMNFRLPVTDK